MSLVYKINYDLSMLNKTLQTNEDLYNNIFNIINIKTPSIIYFGLYSDEKYKYEADLKNKLPFLNKLINKYDIRDTIPYYEEEIKSINFMLTEYNKDSCVVYKQSHPLVDFFSDITKNKNILYINIDDTDSIPIALLKKKYDDFPNKINLLSIDSSENDIIDIKENIEQYYKLQENEIARMTQDTSVYKFEPFNKSGKIYNFYKIKYLIHPRPTSGVLQPEKEGNEFMLAITKFALKYKQIIIINEILEINYIIIPNLGIKKLLYQPIKTKCNIIRDMYKKLTNDEYTETNENIMKMLECEYIKTSFLL
jgi:hypothetical protein